MLEFRSVISLVRSRYTQVRSKCYRICSLRLAVPIACCSTSQVAPSAPHLFTQNVAVATFCLLASLRSTNCVRDYTTLNHSTPHSTQMYLKIHVFCIMVHHHKILIPSHFYKLGMLARPRFMLQTVAELRVTVAVVLLRFASDSIQVSYSP